jgi:uncharacterized caspase-like protein
VNELHFGLCIGIDRYPGFPGRDLSSATRDARSFRDWLTAPSGGALPEGNVALVTVEANEPFDSIVDARPKMHEVVQALDTINERLRSHLAVNPEDWARTRVYIYAAGHGVAIPNGEGAVLMADAKPALLGFNVDLSLYADWYAHCGLVHEVIVFVDCCREVADGMPPGVVLFQQCRFPANKGSVRFIAYASRWAEQAWEPIAVDDPNLTRGYFTEALLDGLNGAAEEADTKQVTAASLAAYVAQAVEAKTRPPVAPYPQRAEMPVDLAVRLVLRDAPAAPAGAAAPLPGAAAVHSATIHFPAGFTGEAVIRSGDGTVRGRWRAVDGTWKVSLPDSFYQVVPDPPGGATFQGEGLFALVGADADVHL